MGTISRKAFATPVPVAAEIARAEDVFEIPAFLRRNAAPGGVCAGLVEDAVTSREVRERAPGYVAPEALPGRAADYYWDGDFGDINDALRAGRRPPTERLRAIADDMKSAMTPLAEDVTVWRGRTSVKTHRIDEEIVDKAFTSTSASWRTAQRFADASGEGGGTLYLIRAPKGPARWSRTTSSRRSRSGRGGSGASSRSSTAPATAPTRAMPDPTESI